MAIWNLRVRDYIKMNAKKIIEIADALGVMPEAIAGAIAEEHEYLGAKYLYKRI